MNEIKGIFAVIFLEFSLFKDKKYANPNQYIIMQTPFVAQHSTRGPPLMNNKRYKLQLLPRIFSRGENLQQRWFPLQ